MTSSPIQPGTNYTVQQNDNLTTIAQRAYGNGNLWPKIYDYPPNKQVIGNDPNHILPGEVLYIPQLNTGSPIQPGTNYTVQQNDNLTTIAQRAYGDGNLWPKIYNYPANKQVIGNDPNYILPGEVLYIPLPITTCTVTAVNGLRVRAAPNTQSAIIATYPSGTVLNFVEVVNGENVNGNPNWGHSEQGHYFWLGGTDHPNG